ncbi:MAG: hypothetical protein D6769_02130, partial [Methanobacteriota archaeon]
MADAFNFQGGDVGIDKAIKKEFSFDEAVNRLCEVLGISQEKACELLVEICKMNKIDKDFRKTQFHILGGNYNENKILHIKIMGKRIVVDVGRITRK